MKDGRVRREHVHAGTHSLERLGVVESILVERLLDHTDAVRGVQHKRERSLQVGRESWINGGPDSRRAVSQKKSYEF